MSHPHREPVWTCWDPFFFAGCEENAKDLELYKPGGFHPIILGDVLSKPGTCLDDRREPRYRVRVKLGHGAFGTVWLARHLELRHYILIRVCCGTDATTGPCQEAEILAKLRNTAAGEPGREYIIELFGTFVIQGPSGFHDCFVTEVVGPLTTTDFPANSAWDLVHHQVLDGLAFLHAHDVAHGDPHPGNFGIALPQLDQFDEDAIFTYFWNLELVPVIARDPLAALNSLPAYVTPSVCMSDFLKAQKALPAGPTVSIKIFDVGRAHETTGKLESLPGGVPTMFRPPETIIHDRSSARVGSVWSKAADIWAVGCTLYRIRTYSSVTSGWADVLSEALRHGGPPSDAWLPFLKGKDNNDERPLSCVSRDEAWNVRERNLDPPHHQRDEKSGMFIDLLKKMIVTDPDKRCPAAELLRRPFFSDRKGSRVSTDGWGEQTEKAPPASQAETTIATSPSGHIL